jgi:hypothetical protein
MLPDPAPTVTIVEDGGGLIDQYEAKAAELYFAGSRVRIDGLCASACTFVLKLPRDRVCVTPRAKLWFHQGWREGRRSERATRQMWNAYPTNLQHELRRRGGLTAKWIKLKGAVLRRFFNGCA